MFGRRKKQSAQEPAHDPAEVYRGLRDQVMRAAEIVDCGDQQVAAVMVETGSRDYVSNIVAVCDGTSSLYTNRGFGIIGGGFHDSVLQANHALLAEAEQRIDDCVRDSDDRLPGAGKVIIRIMTKSRRYSMEASEDDLGQDRHLFSPLFHAGHRMLSELIKISESRS
jgi:hypothetical protein